MSYRFKSHRHGGDRASLLGPSPDDDNIPAFEPGSCSRISSREPSPSQDSHRPAHTSQSTLNLEFGPAEPPQPSNKTSVVDRRIDEAIRDLESKVSLANQRKDAYHRVMDEIGRLDRRYTEEKDKAPINPSKGTWFHNKRKKYAAKKERHDQTLQEILERKQLLTDRELRMARRQYWDAFEAVQEPQEQLSSLRRYELRR